MSSWNGEAPATGSSDRLKLIPHLSTLSPGPCLRWGRTAVIGIRSSTSTSPRSLQTPPAHAGARFLGALHQLRSAPAGFQKASQEDPFGAATAQGQLLVEGREAFYPIKGPLQLHFQIKK